MINSTVLSNQFTCPITGLLHGSSLILPSISKQDYLATFPIFSLTESHLCALRYELSALNKLELQLVVLAALQKFHFFSIPSNFGESLPRTFWIKEGVPYAFLREFAAEVLAALDTYRSLPSSKKELVPLVQSIPSSFHSWKLLMERAKELLSSIRFATILKKKAEVAGTAEALTSHAASNYFSSLSPEEVTFHLDCLVEEGFVSSDTYEEVLEFAAIPKVELITKEQIATFNLAALSIAEVIDQTSIEEVSIIYYFKSLLEEKKNVVLERACIGNFKIWTGSISSVLTDKIEKAEVRAKQTLAERIAQARGSVSLSAKQLTQVADSISLEDL